ncbi:MAG: 5-(carboxyamino)imidazole ribonucleotide mutase [Candidatus Aminicenantes bacterium]|jgi:phosphoribosylaminoimidazole carboxylase PurE protein|nr:5-(carboxyamino)imidazole ribonucleotide mutase [Candidatus Aminicenantes bacterium]
MDVVIFIGSESDFDIAKNAIETLRKFDIPFALEICSAHRSPERTLKLVRKFEDEGAEVFIAVAGKAAHLAGVVAAHTVRPVIGVPVESGGLGGLDALLSTVQMPKGVPVATMGTGETGAANAALLAVEILSLKKPALRKKLLEHKKKMASQVEADSEKLKKTL